MSSSGLIFEIIDARLSEIAISKKCITTAKGEVERIYLFQCAVVTIYAALEGGVKDLLGILVRLVNASNCKIDDLTPTYAHAALDGSCRLGQEITDYQKKIKATSAIIAAVSKPAQLPESIDVGSNLSPAIVKKLVAMFLLNYQMGCPSDEQDLNILLRFRNNIAHGDRKMPIDFDRIDKISKIAIKILTDFAVSVDEACKQKVWMK